MTKYEKNIIKTLADFCFTPIEKFGSDSYWDAEKRRTRIIWGGSIHQRRIALGIKSDVIGDGFTFNPLESSLDMELVEDRLGVSRPSLLQRAENCLKELNKRNVG